MAALLVAQARLQTILPLLCSAELLWTLAQAPRRPPVPRGLQDPSDPASVPRASLAPLKHKAARFTQDLQGGFHSTCPLPGIWWPFHLETHILHFLDKVLIYSVISHRVSHRVLRTESSHSAPPFIFNPQVPQPFLLFRGLSPGTFWKMLGKLFEVEVT